MISEWCVKVTNSLSSDKWVDVSKSDNKQTLSGATVWQIKTSRLKYIQSEWRTILEQLGVESRLKWFYVQGLFDFDVQIWVVADTEWFECDPGFHTRLI